MSDCTQLSDRMPEVAKGLLRWSASDEKHLAACADCSAEWDLVRRAAFLGASLEPLDAERVAGNVITTLRAPAPRRSGLLARWVVPVALAAGLLVVLRLQWPSGAPGDAGTVLSLLPEAEWLSDAELESVIQLIPSSEPADLRAVDSLTDEELNLMLEDMEG